MKLSIVLILAATAITTIHTGNLATADNVLSKSACENDGSIKGSEGSLETPEVGGRGTDSTPDKGPANDSGPEGCPDACPQVYDLFTDESGTSYPNECMMRMAKCKAKEKEVDVVEEYERLYGKRSGASCDDDANNSVGSDETPESDAASRSDGRDEDPSQSKCPNVLCPDVYSPVYDGKGNRYSNQCYMDAAKCKGPKENPLDEYKRIYGKEFGAGREDESKTKSGENSLRQ